MSVNKVTAKISGLGKSLPEKRLTNNDLEKIVDTSDEWITKRVGIKERRIAQDGQTTSYFAVKASAQALERSGIKAGELDLILVATSTPDTIYPSTACIVQKELGAVNAGVLDVSAACTGFVYACGVAWGMIRSGLMKNILVVGAEVNSVITNWQDRGTCVLFGDGAGAAVLTAHASNDEGILAVKLGGDGNYGDQLNIINSGCRVFKDDQGNTPRYITMQGNEIFKLAVRGMQECAESVLSAAGLTSTDVDLLIPHQANTRIIDAVARRLGLGEDKVFVNIQKYGNTSAATVPIAMCEAYEEGRIKKGDIIILDAFGGGLTWGAVALRWA